MSDTNRHQYKIGEYLELFNEDWEADRVNRERARDDLEFVAGEQWDENDKAAREAERRPCLTINRLPQFIRQVVGDLRNLKPSIKVRPNGSGATEDVADVLNGIVRNIEQRSKDEQPYTSAVESAVRCGIGHFRIVTQRLNNNPFAQDIFIKPIHNPNAVLWDADARSITRTDAKRCWVREGMTHKAFKRKYKGARVIDFADSDYDALSHSNWVYPDMVMLAEIFEITEAKAPFALLEDGSVLRLDRLPAAVVHDELNGLIRRIDGAELFIEETREAPVRKVDWKKVSGFEVLDRGEWPTEDIPIISVLGEEVHFEKNKERASLIRWAKDPQRLYNFWRSTQTEIMGGSPKAPYLIGESQIGGYEAVWAEANVGNKAFLPYGDKTNPTPPQRAVPPLASSGMNNEIALAAEDMKATTGIYDAALGAQSNETAGVAIRQRQQEGDISTNFFGDNLSASMRRAGKILIDLIPIIYDTQRVIRIVKEDESDEEVPVNELVLEGGAPRIYNDLTIGDYDVSVDIGPSYTTRRQEAIEGMVQLLQGNPQLTAMFLDIIAKRSDWPGADEFAERAKKLLPPQLQEEEEELTPEQQAMRQQAAQLEALQAQLGMKKAEGEIAEQQAKTEKLSAETEQTLLENAMKKLELSFRSGEMREVMEQIIRQTLAPPEGARSTPQPIPAEAGFFNAEQ